MVNQLKHADITQTLFKLAAEFPLDNKKYFKTGPGEYAQHDNFIGVRTPFLRSLSKNLADLDLNEIKPILHSSFNEERLLALLVLVLKYQKFKANRFEVYQFYIDNLDYVNNWNLVDSSAHYILGAYLFDKQRSLLMDLVQSKNIWHRRVSIIASFYFIRKFDYSDTLKLARILISDRHDLIHKATGWMLREVGKRNQALLIEFLKENHLSMPKVMLRYAVEKLPKNLKIVF